MAVNRGKRSITLNLKVPEAVAVAKKLVRTHDIVLEQFRPGVMEKLGLGYEQLRKENESVIYCSITGYGQDGPYRDRAGHDIKLPGHRWSPLLLRPKRAGARAPGVSTRRRGRGIL